MASVLIRPPARAYSIRPRCVMPRFAPSPTTRARRSTPSTRNASLARSPTSRCVSSADFTYVPIPPNHRRSTSDVSMARISPFGVVESAFSPNARLIPGVSLTDLAERSKTPPPSEISFSSKSVHAERGSSNSRLRSAQVPAGSGSGSTKICRLSKAPINLIRRESSIPFPNTSPAMPPMPTTTKSSVCVSRPISRKWRSTASQAPRAVMPIRLWSYPSEPPEAKRVSQPEAVAERHPVGDVRETSRCPCRRPRRDRDRRRRTERRPSAERPCRRPCCPRDRGARGSGSCSIRRLRPGRPRGPPPPAGA